MMCDSTELIIVISVSLRMLVYKYFFNPLLDKYNNVYAQTRNIHVYLKKKTVDSEEKA